jgi:hypothetical protein
MEYNITVNPETEKMKAEIESLRKEFIKFYTKKDEMLSVERDDLYIRYVNLLGKDKYENYRLSVVVRALKLKVELAQAALNRNEKPDVVSIEHQVDDQLQDYYKIVEDQAKALREAQDAVTVSKFDVKEAHDLFRVLVRRLHPDLHPDQPDKMTDLFIKGQTAYRTHNLGLLREIIMRLDVNDDVDDLLSKSDESLEEVRQRLQTQISEIKNDIELLENSFPFNLKENLFDETWVKQQQEELKKEHEQLEEQEKIYTERFSLITDV